MRKQQTFAVTQAEYCFIWEVAALTAAGKEYKMLKDQLEKSLQILALEAQVRKSQAEQGYSVTEHWIQTQWKEGRAQFLEHVQTLSRYLGWLILYGSLLGLLNVFLLYLVF